MGNSKIDSSSRDNRKFMDANTRREEYNGRHYQCGGQNDDFRPLSSTLGGRGMGCRDKYVTS